MKISVIIPAYNEERRLPETLARIRQALSFAGRPAEIIVVDNDSRDATRQIAEACEAKVIFYWRLSRYAKRNDGYLHFIEQPPVITSKRRFDKMKLAQTLLRTHPLFIWLNWKKKSSWKDWYDGAIR
jgi:glycosyltransferase involved in cell wall biosynthesis